jgi:hypothetical protein
MQTRPGSTSNQAGIVLVVGWYAALAAFVILWIFRLPLFPDRPIAPPLFFVGGVWVLIPAIFLYERLCDAIDDLDAQHPRICATSTYIALGLGLVAGFFAPLVFIALLPDVVIGLAGAGGLVGLVGILVYVLRD